MIRQYWRKFANFSESRAAAGVKKHITIIAALFIQPRYVSIINHYRDDKFSANQNG